VNFLNQSTNNEQGTTNFWSFGDGSSSTLQNPIHTYLDSAIFRPLLHVTNAVGCWDTVSHPIYVVYAAVDVAIQAVFAEMQNGYINFTVNMVNQGRQSIKALNLSAKYNGGYEITEQWTGSLLAGESILYRFSSKLQLPSNQPIQYYCIAVEIPSELEQIDEYPGNNQLCKNISNEYWIGTIYPNPVADNLQLDLVVPYVQAIEFQITDLNGRIYQTYSHNAHKGLNQISIAISQLAQGQYLLRIVTEEGEEVRKFFR
jgi:PKD repeat protein